MNFVVGVVIAIVVAWILYGLLSAAGVDNAGDVAAYVALGVCVVAGLVFWFRDEVASASGKTCPDCKSDIPFDARVCRHCRHEFA